MDKDPHTIWEDDEGLWWTDYPPPVDFDGEEKGDYGDFHDRRTLTPADQAAVDAGLAANLSLKRATAEAPRDAFFARSGERRVGQGCVRTCRLRWEAYQSKK